jgi:hypothetical protein
MDIEAFPVASTTVMLVVGQIGEPAALPRIPGFHFRPFEDVDRALLARLQPEVVLSALIARDFDAVELGRLLREEGFTGRYRAVTRSLPNIRAVVAEIRATVPGLDFDVFVMDSLRHG